MQRELILVGYKTSACSQCNAFLDPLHVTNSCNSVGSCRATDVMHYGQGTSFCHHYTRALTYAPLLSMPVRDRCGTIGRQRTQHTQNSEHRQHTMENEPNCNLTSSDMILHFIYLCVIQNHNVILRRLYHTYMPLWPWTRDKQKNK